MKIKIIDLLNKIANDEKVPEKIKYNNKIWEYYVYTNDYKGEDIWLFEELFEYRRTIEFINDEVEIIEEQKKINKIRIDYNSINIDKAFETGTTTFFREKDIEIFQCLSSKINELIDEINNLKEND